MEDAYRQEVGDKIWAGVVFTGDFASGWPKDITYKLRVAKGGNDENSNWNTENTFPYFQTFGFRNNDTTGDRPGKINVVTLFLSLSKRPK